MNRPLIAERFLQPEENLLMEIATLAKKTQNLIDLSIGDPDLITDATIIEAAFADVKAGHTKYTASDGSADFIQTVVDFYQKQYQLTFSPSQVRGTVGALHGMYLALAAIIDPGDEVIIHEPYFSPYKQQVELVGGVPVFIPTFEKDGFQIDVEVLKSAITEKTRAIIINSPNNPTGAVFSPETFEKIAAVAIEHDLLILSDEVYEAFCFDDTFVPMAAFAPENTITFSSFSKAFAMTGWRIGYMIAPESINLTAKLINEAIAYSAPTPSQRAGIYALNHYDTLVPQVVAVFKERLTYIEQRVAEIPFLSLSPVKGSMYAFINIEQTGLDSVSFVEKLLKETSVLMIPGKAFGETTGDGYVRLAATQSLDLLKEAFDRIAACSFD
ncbi:MULTISPECIES: pyridoxal phosphate-dependent aminotransferase [unclassified Enterococcus]|jgi:aspartate/methionine/tyrosine aminotransferase|uniref:pyridoxal phosphate-dependent aminotransferase n=1 Tax=unclassified Enterococcus TaxID=2608891 RepID=UPI0019076BC5|nr:MULTISPECIES: pyridoxal phosphate-dependent aminotransferase [Enterococcus]MBW9322036.1 pyridoxal phosphate-dependent aminotransferase [Enterococcus casseliflavus]MBK0036497.1 pyridoxal phosphate-dependent aminotransferase [Enterococcus sp. S52]MBK0069160.1 pyridoxal phosphate-dependent aminotransferase [Enterococcus sp. S53]MBK0139753.1 pyridoxal phosphate-dependent aminotransferase [Enterococcus sp. S76]MBK0143788.1 pyridoxal phosphate-dependent aminotransferase [Enterococcus sp. S77]